MTRNPDRGDDRVTLSVRTAAGAELATIEQPIPEAFDGFWRFQMPDGGVEVTVGEPLP
jgi:hypothetical protein